MKKHVGAFIKTLGDLCFPPACLSCGVKLIGLKLLFCPACREEIKLIQSPLCSCCGKPFPFSAGGDHICGICLKKKWRFNKARSIFQYNDTIAPIVHSFKYAGSTTAIRTFAALKDELPHLNDFTDVDHIIPVPLHAKRLKERGFNQALLLGKAFFPKHKNKISPYILERHRWTIPQTGLSGIERRKNLKDAFQVRYPEKIKRKKVVLVDDIYTTGTTVNECARTLKRSGAKEVLVLTLAQVTDAT